MEGLNDGLRAAMPKLRNTLNDISNTISGTRFNANASLAYAGANSALMASASSGTVYNVYINGTKINDDAQIENKFADLIKVMARKGMM